MEVDRIKVSEVNIAKAVVLAAYKFSENGPDCIILLLSINHLCCQIGTLVYAVVAYAHRNDQNALPACLKRIVSVDKPAHSNITEILTCQFSSAEAL